MSGYILIIDTDGNTSTQSETRESEFSFQSESNNEISYIVKVNVNELYKNISAAGWEYPAREANFEILNVNTNEFGEKIIFNNWELNSLIIAHENYGRWTKKPKIQDKNGKINEIPYILERWENYDTAISKVLLFFNFICQFQDYEHYEKYCEYNNSISNARSRIENSNSFKYFKNEIDEIEEYLTLNQKFNFFNKTQIPSDIFISVSGGFGTGKTTFINFLSKYFNYLGYLNSEEIHLLNPFEIFTNNENDSQIKLTEFFKISKGQLILIDVRLLNQFNNYLLNETIIEQFENGSLMIVFEGAQEDLDIFFSRNRYLGSKIIFSFNFPKISDKTILQFIKAYLESIGFIVKNNEDPITLKWIFDYQEKNIKGVENFYLVKTLSNQIIIKDSKIKSKSKYMSNEKLKIIDFLKLNLSQ